jgi:hypothetical protein
LRKDAPIVHKSAISKTEQAQLDNDILDFINSIPKIEQKAKVLEEIEDKKLSAKDVKEQNVRTTTLKINSTKQEATNVQKTSNKKVDTKTNSTTKKSVKPRDYREWDK